eukprot:5401408-Amphidinium_carterae.1
MWPQDIRCERDSRTRWQVIDELVAGLPGDLRFFCNGAKSIGSTALAARQGNHPCLARVGRGALEVGWSWLLG